MLEEMVIVNSKQVGKWTQGPAGRGRGLLVEIFGLSRGKLGVEIG